MSIRLIDASVSYGGIRALTDVRIDVEPGRVTSLIGPNGAGKSTLVNAITGYSRLASGSIEVDGQDVTRWPVHRRAAMGIARTFQTPRVKPDSSLRDNVIIGAYPRTRDNLLSTVLRLPRQRRLESQAQEAAHEALERFGLRDDMSIRAVDLPIWSLRLLEVARAISASPRYVLLDEPAAGVDQAARDRLGSLVRDLAASDIGVLLIEHNFGFVREVSDHVVVLDQGSVLVQGAPAEVERDQNVIDSYLGGARHD